MDIQQNLSDMIEEFAETHDKDDTFLLDNSTVKQLLEESNISEEKATRIEQKLEEAFGENLPVAEYVIDQKALEKNAIRLEKLEMQTEISTLCQELSDKKEQLEERTTQLLEKQEEINNYMTDLQKYDIVLHVTPQKANQVQTSMINGQKCLIIPMEEHEQAIINGINTVLSN